MDARAFIANNQNNEDSYVELDLKQSLTVCPGANYNFNFNYYLTDLVSRIRRDNIKRQGNPNKKVYVYAYIDDVFIKGILDSHPAGPSIVWRTLTGTFTTTSVQARLKTAFVATDFLELEWGFDNVVVTPAWVRTCLLMCLITPADYQNLSIKQLNRTSRR
ncbi:MAG: hypothetical protein LQ337_003931 [Flavoplaca oasis]|nr:MAG: hypothetical protein LQ337_003931 [Flavoplaca oasis]